MLFKKIIFTSLLGCMMAAAADAEKKCPGGVCATDANSNPQSGNSKPPTS